MALNLISIILTIIASFIGSFGALYLKKSSQKFSFNLKLILSNSNLLKGISLYVVATVLYILALRKGHLSVLYPMVSITYIFITILSVKELHEPINKYKIIGMSCIIVGIILIGIGS